MYAPTADRSEEEHKDFYDELGDLVRSQKCSYLVVMGDFNARVGPRKPGEHYIGTNGVEAPAKRWTHVSPNGQHFHELDHILCSRRAITDTGVVPSFSTGSDHRLLRARFHSDRGQIRLARVESRRPRISELNEELVRAAVGKVDFGICADIDEDYEQLTTHLATIARQSRVAAPNHCVRRISEATKSLLARRRNMDGKANHLEFTLLNKLCRQKIAEDHQDFARRKLLEAAVNRTSLKKVKRDIAEYRHVIPCLKAPDGSRQSSRAGMESIVSKFYTDLYKSNLRPNRQQPAGEEVPSILPSEVRHAIESMPRGKAPGTDKLSVELLQACGDKLYCALAKRFTVYISECKVPAAWKKSSAVLLFKKGDKEDLENYRPITLLPVLYKVFTRCILARIRGTLKEAQPIEQAGFRKGYSTLDHILTCCRLIEVAQEYHEPLVLTFVDYKKAFDFVEPAKECYTGCHTVFRPFCRDVAVAVERGVRQGDPISPCLFSACSESTIRRCDWEPFGVEVSGVRLNHLRFADDIVLVTKTPEDASRMLNGLHEAGKEAGLTTNTTKTKVLRNSFCSLEPVLLQGVALEDVKEY
ncbi:unnamed protein product, partial [Nippostrongylus brasiliensis]|uniref:Reverse transcriptase domain-containing protein n=1 Tax=Nippostrongylus brasiliensis TaxID=27835 RepID=A0A0N4YXT9_NIPBR